MLGNQDKTAHLLQRENTRLQKEGKTQHPWLLYHDFSKFRYFASVGRVKCLPHYSEPPPRGRLRYLLPHLKEHNGGIEFHITEIHQSASFQSAKTDLGTWINIWSNGTVEGSKHDKY